MSSTQSSVNKAAVLDSLSLTICNLKGMLLHVEWGRSGFARSRTPRMMMERRCLGFASPGRRLCRILIRQRLCLSSACFALVGHSPHEVHLGGVCPRAREVEITSFGISSAVPV